MVMRRCAARLSLSRRSSSWLRETRSRPTRPRAMAHLVMVENPPQHPKGDFNFGRDGTLRSDGEPKYTYSGIAVYDPRILTGWREVIGDVAGVERSPPRFKLAPLLFDAMARGEIHGEHHDGRWTDVGTPERLARLDEELRGINTSELIKPASPA